MMKRTTPLLLAAVLLAAVVWTACNGDGPGTSDGKTVADPDLLRSPTETVVVADAAESEVGLSPALIELLPDDLCTEGHGTPRDPCIGNISAGWWALGETQEIAITVRNQGQGLLQLESIALLYDPPIAGEDPPGFSLKVTSDVTLPSPNQPLPLAPFGKPSPGILDELELQVVYIRHPGIEGRQAELVFVSNAVNAPTATVYFTACCSLAALDVEPATVDFGAVAPGDSAEEVLTISNIGGKDLALKGFKTTSLVGGSCFSLNVKGKEFDLADAQDAGHSLSDAFWVSPGEQDVVTVRFEPEDEKPASATVLLYSNDLHRIDGFAIDVLGNQ